MATREHTSVYRPGINAVLHEHEQMSAWLFFAVMSYLVMSFTPGCGCNAGACGGILWQEEQWLGKTLSAGHAAGVQILHSLLLGIWLLYCLKTASLFVRRSTAWAITGLMFIYSTDLWAGPAELNLVLQTVSMYHLMVWARGKKDNFPARHLFIAGMGVTVALMTTPGAVFFWLPVLGMQLWVNRDSRLKSTIIFFAGLLTPWLAVLPISIVMALSTPSATDLLSNLTSAEAGTGGWQSSLLYNKPTELFYYALPGFCHTWLPVVLAVIAGHFLLFMWLRPFQKIRRNRKTCINTTLGISFMAVFWVCFCTGGPVYATFLYPFILISIIGIILMIRRRLRNRTAKRVLRGIGLMTPFITLMVLLLIPVIRTALGQ